MAEPDNRVLDYGRPAEGRHPSPPVRDSTLLVVCAILLFGPWTVLGALFYGRATELSLLAAAVTVFAWAIGSVTMVVMTKRRLHPSPVQGDRPNRIILAFAFSGLSLVLLISSAYFGVAKVRNMSTRISCQENLRTVGQAIYMYANNNKGYFPPDLTTLVRGKILTVRDLQCPAAPPPSSITLTPATTDQDTISAGATAYIYFGDPSIRMNSIPNAAIVPLVIELPGNHSDGLVLFADGHSEACTPHDVALILSSHLAQRRTAATTQPAPATTR